MYANIYYITSKEHFSSLSCTTDSKLSVIKILFLLTYYIHILKCLTYSAPPLLMNSKLGLVVGWDLAWDLACG